MRVISNCDIYSDAQFLLGRLILDIDPPPHSCILFSICVHDPPPHTHIQPAPAASCWITATAPSHRGEEGVSLPESLRNHPLCPLSRCPASDDSWRLQPCGSGPGRGDPGRSSRPATTRDTWRSEARRRR